MEDLVASSENILCDAQMEFSHIDEAMTLATLTHCTCKAFPSWGTNMSTCCGVPIHTNAGSWTLAKCNWGRQKLYNPIPGLSITQPKDMPNEIQVRPYGNSRHCELSEACLVALLAAAVGGQEN